VLFKSYDKKSGKVIKNTKPLLIKPTQGYMPPAQGSDWFQTTTTVWRVDELMLRRVRDWRRLLGESGHDGERSETFRGDHNSVYTGTYSVFPAPLVEWILLRYSQRPDGLQPGVPCRVLDAFAGGPPRGAVSGIMGYEYHGIEVRQQQIDENKAVMERLGLKNVHYHLDDGRFMDIPGTDFDIGLTCPPYYDLEVYSDLTNDISASSSYQQFNADMAMCAASYLDKIRPLGFVCVVVGPFRDKNTGELRDFPGHTIANFREAGFIYWQDIILSKNFGSAAQRSTNAWRGKKLVPIHEHLLVFRKPEG
jgi:hypothetical protein